MSEMPTGTGRASVQGAALGLLLVAAPAAGDVVELRTGQRVEGALKEVSPENVVIESAGQLQRIERAKVRAIYLDAPGPASNTPVGAAIEALKAVQAATKSPEAFKSYESRLGDAKTAVNRYLQSPSPGDPAIQGALKIALQYYIIGSSATRPHMTDADFAAVGQDPALDQCPQIKDVIAAAQKMSPKTFSGGDQARNRGLTVSMFGLGAVWACAADRVAEAERLADKSR
jgi:hypothetical protein